LFLNPARGSGSILSWGEAEALSATVGETEKNKRFKGKSKSLTKIKPG